MDLRLIARLTREPLAPATALADEAGLTANAARARLARLRTQGVLMGTFALPNPALFGRVARIAIYPAGSRAEPARALDVPDVQMFSHNHDGQLAITWLARAEDEAPPAALDRFVGKSAPRVLTREHPPLLPPGAAMATPAWAILEALVHDARASHRELAAATGLGERAVARQKTRLIAGNRALLVTGVLSNLAEGIVLFHLYVAGKGALDDKRVCAAAGGALVQDRTRDPPGLYVFGHAASFGDALLARDRVAALPGIDHVELILEKEAGVAKERLAALCRAERERALASRAPHAR